MRSPLSRSAAAACLLTALHGVSTARGPHHRFPLPPVKRPPAARTPPPAPPPTAARVVLVHGFLDTGNIWRKLEKRLTAQGYRCFVPKLSPNDGRSGLDDLAEKLRNLINQEFGTEEPLSIVAFSMGGLVSRHYLQHLGGASRCSKFFTISSPHNGTKTALLYPSKGVRQMRPDSPFLSKLAASEASLGPMTVVSYRTPMDLIIVPSKNSLWQRATNISCMVPLHPMMPGSETLIRDLETRLAN